MKTKSLVCAQSNRSLSVAEANYVAEQNSKGTTFVSFPDYLTPGESVDVLEVIEAANEQTAGGSVRLMAKSSLKVPRTAWDAVQGAHVPTGAMDALTAHVVLALPKEIVRVLSSAGESDALMRQVLAFGIARAMMNSATVLLNTTKVVAPAATAEELAADLLAANGPIRRAIAGLTPLDAANGSYGSLT